MKGLLMRVFVRNHFWRIVVALLVGFIFICGAYIVLRVRTLYAIQTEVAKVVSEQQDLHERLESTRERIELRVDQLERILFGDVIAAMEKKAKSTNQKPPPNWIELWQRNRDKELRDRIMALERRMYQLER